MLTDEQLKVEIKKLMKKLGADGIVIVSTTKGKDDAMAFIHELNAMEVFRIGNHIVHTAIEKDPRVLTQHMTEILEGLKEEVKPESKPKPKEKGQPKKLPNIA